MGNIVFSRGKHNRYDATVGNTCVGWARYNEQNNYISLLWVSPAHRRLGVATALVRFIASDRRVVLNRAPEAIKTDIIKALGVKMGDELGPEYSLEHSSRAEI